MQGVNSPCSSLSLPLHPPHRRKGQRAAFPPCSCSRLKSGRLTGRIRPDGRARRGCTAGRSSARRCGGGTDRRWVGSGVRRGMGRSVDGKASWRRGWAGSGMPRPCVGIDGLGRPEVHKDRRVSGHATTGSHTMRDEADGTVHAGRLQAAKPDGHRAAETVDGSVNTTHLLGRVLARSQHGRRVLVEKCLGRGRWRFWQVGCRLLLRVVSSA